MKGILRKRRKNDGNMRKNEGKCRKNERKSGKNGKKLRKIKRKSRKIKLLYSFLQCLMKVPSSSVPPTEAKKLINLFI